MLITVEQLEKYTDTYSDESDTVTAELLQMFIGSAQAEIVNYLGYNPEDDDELEDYQEAQIKNVCLEIAALITMERGGNLGVSSSSDAGGIGRSFLNVVDYSKYLAKLSAYRKNTEM